MPDSQRKLDLTILHQPLSVCRVDPHEPVPSWAASASFASITRTSDELSIIAPSSVAPSDVRRSDGWRALKLEGPFAFSEHGVLDSVTTPLARAGVPVLTVCTYDTDYILVQQASLARTVEALEHAGHQVSHEA